jgi:hypothetical protein
MEIVSVPLLKYKILHAIKLEGKQSVVPLREVTQSGHSVAIQALLLQF